MKKYNVNKKETHATRSASKMPSLYHTLPNKEFDITKSEVIKWLVAQPEVVLAMFDYYRAQGAIVYDSDTHMWVGSKTSTRVSI